LKLTLAYFKEVFRDEREGGVGNQKKRSTGGPRPGNGRDTSSPRLNRILV